MNNNRKGISNVVATIILIAVAIALAVAVAVWVFGLAGSASKTATLTVMQGSLTVSSSGAILTFMVNNPSGTSISLSGFTLGSLTCTVNSTKPLVIPGGASGQLEIQFSSGFAKGTAIFAGSNSASFTCTGNQTFVPGVQYSGTLITTSGQTYPFTVTASS